MLYPFNITTFGGKYTREHEYRGSGIVFVLRTHTYTRKHNCMHTRTGIHNINGTEVYWFRRYGGHSEKSSHKFGANMVQEDEEMLQNESTLLTEHATTLS